jgi:hypothetical protein
MSRWVDNKRGVSNKYYNDNRECVPGADYRCSESWCPSSDSDDFPFEMTLMVSITQIKDSGGMQIMNGRTVPEENLALSLGGRRVCLWLGLAYLIRRLDVDFATGFESLKILVRPWEERHDAVPSRVRVAF